MAATTASLLEPIPSFFPNSKPLSLKWNPLLQSLPIRSYRQTRLTLTSSKPIVKFSKPNLPPIKCSNSSKKIGSLSRERRNPFQAILDAIFKTLKSLQKPAIAAVLLGVLPAYNPHSVITASGGRMGGWAFLSSSSYSSSSRSYSVPPSSWPGFSYSVSDYAPTPFEGGGGVLHETRHRCWGGCRSGFFVLMMGFATAILVSGFISNRWFKSTDQMMPLFSVTIYR